MLKGSEFILYEVPTLNQIYEMLLNVAQKIADDGYKPEVVVGILRGGIVPARILLDLLQTPEFATIQIEYYAGINQRMQDPILKQCLQTEVKGKKVLLADDVSDSGKSLQFATSNVEKMGAKEIKTATLYSKPETITTPNYYEKQTSHWIVFPWDAKETVKKILQSCEGKRAINQEIAKLVKAGMPKQLIEKFRKDE